jgi:hypothetical protein
VRKGLGTGRDREAPRGTLLQDRRNEQLVEPLRERLPEAAPARSRKREGNSEITSWLVRVSNLHAREVLGSPTSATGSPQGYDLSTDCESVAGVSPHMVDLCAVTSRSGTSKWRESRA